MLPRRGVLSLRGSSVSTVLPPGGSLSSQSTSGRRTARARSLEVGLSKATGAAEQAGSDVISLVRVADSAPHAQQASMRRAVHVLARHGFSVDWPTDVSVSNGLVQSVQLTFRLGDNHVTWGAISSTMECRSPRRRRRRAGPVCRSPCLPVAAMTTWSSTGDEGLVGGPATVAASRDTSLPSIAAASSRSRRSARRAGGSPRR